MTSGTYSKSNFVAVPTQSGTGYRGDSITKTWSGSDSLPTSSSAPIPAAYPTTIQAFGPGLQTYITGVKRPDFLGTVKTKLNNRPPKRAKLSENPYSMTARSAHYDVYLANNNPVQPLVPNRYGYDCYLIDHSNWTSNDDIALLGRLRTQVAGSDFNLGVSLAESREALGLIADSAIRIAGSYKALKVGDFRSAQRLLLNGNDRAPSIWRSASGKRESHATFTHTSSDNWLAFQYGWLPLMADARAAAEFLAHRHHYGHRQIVRATLKKPLPLQWGGSANALPVRYEGFTVKSIKAVLSERPNTASLLGLTDPLSVAWELVPYSFVADWFLPIGDYLSARGLSNALQGVFVTSTLKVCRFDGLKGGIKGEYGFSQALPPCNLVRDSYVSSSRTVSNSLSIPLPSLQPLGKALSWRRALSSLALLDSAFR